MKMQKGFTLIELLIVVVIVGTLVGVGLPKYQRAVERGRALKAMNDVKYAAEYAAVKNSIKQGNPGAQDITKGDGLFGAVSVEVFNNGVATASISRNSNSGWEYTITAESDEGGQITSITCTSNGEGVCRELGMDELGIIIPIGE